VDGILLITNAAAGSNEEQEVADAVDVLGSDFDVEVAATEHLEELEAVLGRTQGRPIVVAGGDGSLHAVVNGLHNAGQLDSTCLGLVPLGTGNDFARGVGIPLDTRAAAQVVVDGHSQPVDLILDDAGTVIVNNVHLGVGAQASRKAAKWKPRLGKAGYAVGAVSASLRPKFLSVDVFVDDEEVTLEEVVHDHLAQVAIGNGMYVGGGTALIPGAEVGDGQLVVIVSKAVGRWGRVAYAARLRGGSHHMMDEVTRVRGRTVTVKGEPFHIVADGEISGPYTERCWELLRGVVRMFLPAPSEAAAENAPEPAAGPPQGPA
jgi:diacylglycerol kinase (ATP)